MIGYKNTSSEEGDGGKGQDWLSRFEELEKSVQLNYEHAVRTEALLLSLIEKLEIDPISQQGVELKKLSAKYDRVIRKNYGLVLDQEKTIEMASGLLKEKLEELARKFKEKQNE